MSIVMDIFLNNDSWTKSFSIHVLFCFHIAEFDSQIVVKLKQQGLFGLAGRLQEKECSCNNANEQARGQGVGCGFWQDLGTQKLDGTGLSM